MLPQVPLSCLALSCRLTLGQELMVQPQQLHGSASSSLFSIPFPGLLLQGRSSGWCGSLVPAALLG